MNTISPDGSGVHNWYAFDGLTAYSFGADGLTISSDNSGFGAGIQSNNPSSSTPALSSPGSPAVNTGNGVVFRYGYMEAVLSFSPTGYKYAEAVAAGQLNGGDWPAFWLGHSTNGPQNPTGNFGEIDAFEGIPTDRFSGGTPTDGSPAQNTSTLLEWTAGNATMLGQFPFNPPQGVDFTQPNTWGCLWTATSVSIYFNNTFVSSAAIGPGTSYPSTAIDFMGVIMGTGFEWPVTFRKVRIFQ